MKTPLGTLVCMILSFAMLSQNHLSAQDIQSEALRIAVNGTVVDSLTGEGVAFATVAAVNEEGVPVSAVAADGAGKFSLDIKETGELELFITSVGYTDSRTPLKIGGTEPEIDLGHIPLAAGVAIERIVVQRPLITADAEKIIYNVEADPESSTSTLVEILRKVPNLTVDAENNVLLNGQSNYKVLVNGKTSIMMSNNFKEVIKSLPAESVRDIQVITNPSMRYEAEGVGGIINIITSRRTLTGYSGRASLGWASNNMLMGNAYVSAQIGKFSVSANYTANVSDQPKSYNARKYEDFNSEDMHFIISHENYDYHQWIHNLNLSASYEIDTFNLITLSFNAYRYRSNDRQTTITGIFNSEYDIFNSSTETMRSKWETGSISGNIDYQRTFRKPDKMFTISYQFSSAPRDVYNLIGTRYSYMGGIPSDVTGKRSTRDKLNMTEHTVQIDYFDTITPKHNIETGLKYILRLNTSDPENMVLDNGIWTQDLVNLASKLDYDQHVIGVYGGYNLKLDKFSARAGFRVEGTINYAVSNTGDENTEFDSKLFNVVPYASVTYMPKPAHNFGLSYTQRLNRPGIYQLNPYINTDESPFFTTGNKDLETVAYNSFTLTYMTFADSWNLNAALNSSFSNNYIAYLVEMLDGVTNPNDPDGPPINAYINKPFNLGKTRTFGGSLYYSYRLKTLLTVYINTFGIYSIFKSPERNLANEGFSYGVSLGGNVELWKGARLTANMQYNSPGYGLNGKGGSMLFSSFGLSQKLFKEKFDINLSVTQPFMKYFEYNSTAYQPGQFRSNVRQKQHMQRFNITLGYRFGKSDISVKKVRRGISNDDAMSSGSGGDR